MSKDATVYVASWCAYSQAAKVLLANVQLEFDEVIVDTSPDRWHELFSRTGKYEVPQIFVFDTYLGGFQSLAKLLSRCELQGFVAAAKERAIRVVMPSSEHAHVLG